jgi:hypothetical protein
MENPLTIEASPPPVHSNRAPSFATTIPRMPTRCTGSAALQEFCGEQKTRGAIWCKLCVESKSKYWDYFKCTSTQASPPYTSSSAPPIPPDPLCGMQPSRWKSSCMHCAQLPPAGYSPCIQALMSGGGWTLYQPATPTTYRYHLPYPHPYSCPYLCP